MQRIVKSDQPPLLLRIYTNLFFHESKTNYDFLLKIKTRVSNWQSARRQRSLYISAHLEQRASHYFTIIYLKIIVRVFYTDLSYETIEESESYPFQEMINEIAGICNLYCKNIHFFAQI